jgi:hypothetical protein
MRNYETFLYCWTDNLINKLYVGKHKGSIDDRYISSSKYFMEEYRKRPEDFSRQILAVGSDNDIICLETAILKSENASKSDSYYNMHNNNGSGSKFFSTYHTEETKRKLSERYKGKTRSQAFKDSRRRYMSNPEVQKFYKERQSDPAVRAKMSLLKKNLYDGSKNPNAKSVIIDEIKYGTMKEASEKTGLSLYKIRKLMGDKKHG